MTKPNRRVFLKLGAASGAAGLFLTPAQATTLTPSEEAGPFYPVVAQKDKDLDLTRVAGQQGVAKGPVIIIEGQVLDTDGQPLENATIDLWQANAAGRYAHPHDTNPAPLDPNFQGWAILQSNKQGKFRIITIYPGAYPASETWTRPPHIHFKVSRKEYIELTTQMYFPDQNLHEADHLLKRKSKEEAKLMTASKILVSPETYTYTIVLQKA